MATSYALPLNGSATMGQNQRGHTHTRSHHRKAAPDRIPLVQSLMGGGASFNTASPRRELHSDASHAHGHSRSLPINNLLENRQFKHQKFHPTVEQTIPELQHSPELASADDLEHSADMHLNLPTPSHSFAAVAKDDHEHPHDAGSRPWITMREVVNSILIPLPYALTALLLTKHVPVVELDPTIAKLTKALRGHEDDPVILPHLEFFTVCALTSVILLLVGLAGKARGTKHSLDRRKDSLGYDGGEQKPSDYTFVDTVRQISIRILSVGLPFYAAGFLGGERVAISLLIAAAGDFGRIGARTTGLTGLRDWSQLLVQRKWTLAALVLQIFSDIFGFTGTSGGRSQMLGYLALLTSMFAMPLPFPVIEPKGSMVASSMASASDRKPSVAASWEAPTAPMDSLRGAGECSFISSKKDVTLTFTASTLAAVISVFALKIPNQTTALSFAFLFWGLVASLVAAFGLVCALPKTIETERKLRLALGLLFAVGLQQVLSLESLYAFLSQIALIGCAWIALSTDIRLITTVKKHRGRGDSLLRHHSQESHSKITGFLLSVFHDWTLIHSILLEKDSRRIFYFMCLNFGFMLVQTFYSIVTGSLGLLSDSIHMLFDCLALVVGLCAAVMSKWPPSIRFPYGFGKMDTLAGFANGIFLMLISVEIIYEAVERLVEGSHMQRIGELLTVSSAGLVVNLVGMFAFGHAHHGHGHSHGGHDHGHDHGSHDHSHQTHNHSRGEHDHSHDSHSHSHEGHQHHHQHLHIDHPHSPVKADHSHHDHHSHDQSLPHSPLPYFEPSTPSKPPPPQTVAHHHHANENMHGIFLHVLADTLGSVAVVISTICIHYTGWAGFDPLASCLIAILIFASAVPLVASSAKRLLLTVPQDTEFDLREVLAGVGALRGVSGVTVPRFWMGEGEDERVGGVMHVVVGHGVELEDARQRAIRYLSERGMDVLVQVEREGEGRCWCGGGTKPAG